MVRHYLIRHGDMRLQADIFISKSFNNCYLFITKGNKNIIRCSSACLRIAKRMNEEGDHFPILGICLGFELLTYAAANGTEHRSDCNSQNQALPLNFTKGKLIKVAFLIKHFLISPIFYEGSTLIDLVFIIKEDF